MLRRRRRQPQHHTPHRRARRRSPAPANRSAPAAPACARG
jgi:hypothetical protein